MNTSFLQSPEWGTFQAETGVKVRVLETSAGPVQVLTHGTPLGDFWYVAHASVPGEVYDELAKQARAEKVLFLRIEPQASLPILPTKAVLVKNRQPAHTVLLDLRPATADIFAHMHQKTRYSIRASEDAKLRVVWEKNPTVFHALMEQTAARDHFNPHPVEYYNAMLQCPLVEQITVYLHDTPLASAIFVGYQKTYTYLHSASSNEHREVMASYAAQWAAIQHAKAQGFEIYDFWGVAPEGDETHSLAGVTRFKIRFGGTRYTFGQAFEIPVAPFKYWLFTLLKKIRL